MHKHIVDCMIENDKTILVFKHSKTKKAPFLRMALLYKYEYFFNYSLINFTVFEPEVACIFAK